MKVDELIETLLSLREQKGHGENEVHIGWEYDNFPQETKVKGIEKKEDGTILLYDEAWESWKRK